MKLIVVTDSHIDKTFSSEESFEIGAVKSYNNRVRDLESIEYNSEILKSLTEAGIHELFSVCNKYVVDTKGDIKTEEFRELIFSDEYTKWLEKRRDNLRKNNEMSKDKLKDIRQERDRRRLPDSPEIVETDYEDTYDDIG